MKKRLKIFLTVIVSIFSFIFIGNVKAASSDFYDMSQWIDIDEFTLPNGINPDDYNIIIWERGNNGNSNSYRMVYSLKSDNYKIWLSTYPRYLPPSSFPYLTASPGFSKNRIGGYDSIYYYDETILGSKIFNKKQSSSGSFSSGSYIVYSNYDIFYVNGEKLFDTSKINYGSEPLPHTFNFHLNGGHVYDDRAGFEFENWDDFSFTLYSNEVEDFFTNLKVEKQDMLFEGWYYDSGFTQPFTLNDSITTDVDLYAKFRYEKVDDFLRNTNFNQYTFDSSQDYAIITRSGNNDVFLGLPTSRYDIEVYEYQQNFESYKDNTSVCLVPIYNYNNIYYYNLNTMFTNNQEVMILPRSVFDDIENTDYKFLLTDNAYISYTSDLSKVTIVDKEGNIVNTNLENAYENSHISTSENQSQEVQFKKMKIFLNDLKSMNNVWNDCFTYFYNSLPGIVRSLLIFIFNVIMILICLKLVGWK